MDGYKLPPSSVEAEQSVLGGLLLQNEAFDRIADMIGEHDFYREDHRTIWRSIVGMIYENKPADVVTVAERLEARGSLEDVGGLSYLALLAQNTPSAANIRRYAEIVRDKALLRALDAVACTLQDAIHSPDGRTPAEIASEIQTALDTVTAPTRNSSEPMPARVAVSEVIRRADEASVGRDARGLEIGIADLDTMTNGLEPGQLIVVAARPAVGKTAVALAIARHVARAGHRAAFYSLEMSRAELAARLLSAEAQVPARCLRTGPDELQWPALTKAIGAPWNENLYLDDRAAASVAYVRASSRRLDRQAKLGLIAVDYLQLMAPADPRTSRTEQVGSLSRGLKGLAKELHLPVIALAQLNRASESRSDRRPQLSDLRDSGEIEQDADAVLLLHAPSAGVLECNLAKHRHGQTGVFWLDFDATTMTFTRRYGTPKEAKKTNSRGFKE